IATTFSPSSPWTRSFGPEDRSLEPEDRSLEPEVPEDRSLEPADMCLRGGGIKVSVTKVLGDSPSYLLSSSRALSCLNASGVNFPLKPASRLRGRHRRAPPLGHDTYKDRDRSRRPKCRLSSRARRAPCQRPGLPTCCRRISTCSTTVCLVTKR